MVQKVKRNILALVCMLFLALGAKATDHPFWSNASGKPEIGVRAYPNPLLEDKLYVEAEANIIGIEIINVIGGNVYSERETEPTNSVILSLGDLERGVYFVKVFFSGDKYVVKRILKK